MNRKKWIYVATVVFGVLGGLGAIALALDIMEKKQEAQNPFFRVVDLKDDTVDPAVWGKNFPNQYNDYLKTVDQVRTKYGGSEAIPHAPSQADPRSIVSQSRLEEDPRLKTMWAGYAFAVDFREERGHAHMLDDQIFTQRQVVKKQPGTCLNCHASMYVTYKELGNGDIFAGFDKINKMPYSEAVKHVSHPLSCVDCHDTQTMQLRVTRPAFIENIKLAKAAQGIKEYDINKMATHQEMRTFVCAQCHVEYYFKGDEKRLTYPWSKGLKATEILAYYEETGFTDWNHKETGAPVLKAQHPEFEMYSQGTHARSGVSCTDCHMPYKRVGAMKISDHHVRSPLLDVNKSCQTCHRQSETELREKADNIQTTTFNLRDVAMNALMDLIAETKAAREKINNDDLMKEVWNYQKRAQFLLDFVEAENSMGFHAPQEAVRLLGQSIDYSRKGQMEIRRVLADKGIAMPPPKAPHTPRIAPRGPGPAADRERTNTCASTPATKK